MSNGSSGSTDDLSESIDRTFNNEYWHKRPNHRPKEVSFHNLNNIGDYLDGFTPGFISELIVGFKYAKKSNPKVIEVRTYDFERNFTENDLKSINFQNSYSINLNDIEEYLGPDVSELTIGIKYATEQDSDRGIKVFSYEIKRNEERFFGLAEKSIHDLKIKYLPNLKNIGDHLHQYSPFYVCKLNTGAKNHNKHKRIEEPSIIGRDNKYMVDSKNIGDYSKQNSPFNVPKVNTVVKDVNVPNPEGRYFYEKIIRTGYTFFWRYHDSMWIVALLFVFIPAIFYFFPTTILTKDIEKTFCPSMLEYEETHPMRYSYFWSQIQNGMNHVLADVPPEPAVFFLVYSDEYTMTKTLNQITDVVKLCLDSREGVLDIPLSELQSNEVVKNYGLLIEKYRPILETKRVMVVKDVQNVPAPVSPVFHSFCDTSAPVVKRAAIFFTMQMDEDEIPSSYNDLIVKVEKDLQTLWKDGVDVDKIMPLITRMTVNVLPVQPK